MLAPEIAQKEPRELFGILVHELGQVLHFDAIAQFDESSDKVEFHLGPGCLKRERCPSELDKEESIAAWVYEHRETLVLGTLDRETRFSSSTRIMQRAGIQSACASPLNYSSVPLGLSGDCQRAPQRLFYKPNGLSSALAEPPRC